MSFRDFPAAERQSWRFIQLVALLLFVFSQSLPPHYEVQPAWFRFFIDKLNAGIPLFFFLAGILWINGHGKVKVLQPRSVLLKKFSLVILPFFVVGALAYFLAIAFGFTTSYPLEFSTWSFLSSFVFPTRNAIGYFWLLPAAFVIYAFASLFLTAEATAKRLFLLYVITILLHVLVQVLPVSIYSDPFSLLLGLRYLHYFLLGMLAFRYSEFLFKRKVFIALLLLLHVLIFSKLLLPPQIGSFFLFDFAYYSLFIVVLYCSSQKLGPLLMRNPFLTQLANYSYPIIIFCWFAQATFASLIFYPVPYPGITFNIAIVASFFSGLLIPFILAYILDKLLPVSIRSFFGM